MTPYAILLGAELEDLPEPCRKLHAGFGSFEGEITVHAAPYLLLRLAARMVGLPGALRNAPLLFEMAEEGNGARWTRRMGGHVMVSHQRALPDGTLAETMGPVTLAARLVPEPMGLRLETAWVRVLGLRIPRPFWPGVSAREWGEDGRYHFEIILRMPLINTRLIEYRGWLATVESTS